MKIPHMKVVVVFSVYVMIAYTIFSVYVMLWGGDVAQKGDVVGTWKSFAVAAVAFWIGSSSAGKAMPHPPELPEPNLGDQPGNLPSGPIA